MGSTLVLLQRHFTAAPVIISQREVVFHKRSGTTYRNGFSLTSPADKVSKSCWSAETGVFICSLCTGWNTSDKGNTGKGCTAVASTTVSGTQLNVSTVSSVGQIDLASLLPLSEKAMREFDWELARIVVKVDWKLLFSDPNTGID